MLRDTAERGGLTLSLLLSVFSTPPSLRATSPIFCITKHRGGVWLYSLQTCRGLFCFTPPSPYGHSPYISSKTPRNVTGHGRERVVTTVAGFFNPSVTSCHLPYILHYKTQGRSVAIFIADVQRSFLLYPPLALRALPLYFFENTP